MFLTKNMVLTAYLQSVTLRENRDNKYMNSEKNNNKCAEKTPLTHYNTWAKVKTATSECNINSRTSMESASLRFANFSPFPKPYQHQTSILLSVLSTSVAAEHIRRQSQFVPVSAVISFLPLLLLSLSIYAKCDSAFYRANLWQRQLDRCHSSFRISQGCCGQFESDTWMDICRYSSRSLKWVRGMFAGKQFLRNAMKILWFTPTSEYWSSSLHPASKTQGMNGLSFTTASLSRRFNKAWKRIKSVTKIISDVH